MADQPVGEASPPAAEVADQATPRRASGRRSLVLGLGLAVLGIIGYVVQLQLHRLTTPWYMPFLATLGALLVVNSLLQKRSVWRGLALLLVALLAGAEWLFLLTLKLPEYAGPVAARKPFPAFATTRADGTPFTQRDLGGARADVMVFFRGRW
jgi:hypothetical protein